MLLPAVDWMIRKDPATVGRIVLLRGHISISGNRRGGAEITPSENLGGLSGEEISPGDHRERNSRDREVMKLVMTL